MTFFYQSGSQYRATNEENIKLSRELPLGTYTIMRDMAGFFFETVPNLEQEGKIYGDVNDRVKRILTTFNDRPNTTGVMLSGEKGSGKTMLARILSQTAREQGVITLLINSPLAGESFNNLIASITQPALLIFDEFEKVYDRDTQPALLTLFDGVYQSKKLFVVTANDTYKVSDFFKNRPGRFFYNFNYTGLDERFVREYATDNLLDKTQVEPLVTFSKAFQALNFDILKATVEEMNRYGESVSDVMKYLNASPMEQNIRLKLASVAALNPEDAEKYDLEYAKKQDPIRGSAINPFKHTFYVYIPTKAKPKPVKKPTKADDIFGEALGDDEDYGDYEGVDFTFTSDHLKKMANGQYFWNNGQFEYCFEKVEQEVKDYAYFFGNN